MPFQQRSLTRNRGKSPGTQVQHTLKVGTTGAGFRQFLASDCGTVWTITKSARTFAPFTHAPMSNWHYKAGLPCYYVCISSLLQNSGRCANSTAPEVQAGAG